jgi:tetratricopeptide (TPR) repeat protein
VLQEYVERHRDERDVMMHLKLAEYQFGIGRLYVAEQTLQQALPLQDPSRREVNLSLASLYFGREQYDRAREHYLRLVEIRPDDVPLQMRLVECEVRLRLFDDAAARLQKIVEERGANYQTELLAASIAEGRGEDLWARDQREEAARHFAAERSAIERSIRLSPSLPIPYVQKARSLIREAERTGRGAAIGEALAELDHATSIQANYLPAIRERARARLVRTPPDLQGAIGDYGEILALTPRDVNVRRSLLELFLRTDDLARAIDLARESAALFPKEPAWQTALGDLHRQRGDHAAAAEAFAAAYSIEPSRLLLGRMCDARMRMTPPDFRGALELLDAHPQDVAETPVLQCLVAVARSGLGDREGALAALRGAYPAYREAAVKNPRLVGEWFSYVGEVFKGRPAAEAEQFALELVGDAPGPLDRLHLARLWYAEGAAGVSRAVEHLDTALRAAPADDKDLRAAILYELAQRHYVVEDYAGAAAAFEQVREITPDNPGVLNDLAFVYAEHLGRPQDALPLAERAASLRPDSWNIADTLGTVYAKLDRPDDAARELRRSIGLSSTASNNLHLAKVLAAQGLTQQAATHLETAQRLATDAATRAEIQALLDDMRKQ